MEKTITEHEENYKEAEEYAATLLSEMQEIMYTHLKVCLKRMDVDNLVSEYQDKFKRTHSKYVDHHDICDAVHVLLTYKSKRGFNIEDLAIEMEAYLIDRLLYQSNHENPNSLTDYSDII